EGALHGGVARADVADHLEAALALERSSHARSCWSVVVGEQDADLAVGAHGITTSMTVPLPTPDRTRSCPPSACARSRMLTRPNPHPSSVSAGSKPTPLSAIR